MPSHGVCFNCDEHCGSESYCYGCRTFVCSTCDMNPSVSGHSHDADLHLTPDWETEDGE